MKNPRISPKERGLLKGAVRRVFSRSDIRRMALSRVTIEYHDPNRPRVKKWGICVSCKQKTPLYKMQIDHLSPIIPLTTALVDMSWDEIIDATFCEVENLQALCEPCHLTKTKNENKIRRELKKLKKEKKL